MKVSIARKIVVFCGLLLLIFSVTMLIVIYKINQKSAEDNAKNLLGIIENQLVDNDYLETGEFKNLIQYYNTKEIRVTIIALDGSVIADTEIEDSSLIENHLDRKEVTEALSGRLGVDKRKSETLNSSFFYAAKLVSAPNSVTQVDYSVVLRISVLVNSINEYIFGAVLTIIIVFFLMTVLASLFSGILVKNLIKPYELIKSKLDEVLSPDKQAQTIALTKYDDINQMITEIDDISEKLNENLIKYQAEQQKLSFIIENISLGVLAISSENKIILCNENARKFLDFSLSIPTSIHKAIRNKSIIQLISNVVKSGNSFSADMQETNGKVLCYNLYPNPSSNIALIIVIQDVTDIRKLSIEKQEFFENAGHELKTPLSSILGYSELLLNKQEYNRLFIETINKEATRMKDLISDMLIISEFGKENKVIDEKINLKQIIEEVILSHTPKANNKNIQIKSEITDCYIFANYEKITEVVANLVDNSIKYTENSGQITVSLNSNEDGVIFFVQDNGMGIPLKYINRIFERFFRVHKGRSRQEGGTGLGLSIVKHICKQYNAPITVQSKVGVGTKITIVFNAIN